jgi:Domain of unknown function (DUF4335)
MNIQRKYSLPNCTLLLEGLNDASKAAHYQDMRPELSILVNAECYLSGFSQPLVGGREFFESLVRAVSTYAQEFLSNVPNPLAQSQAAEMVHLEKIDTNRHKLTVNTETPWQNGTESSSHLIKAPVELELNTVQLFDLVEAVDQFFADSQTLPELSLELQPVSRRYGTKNQALIKQAVPATVGLSSLAAAALAFSLIPVPQRPQPQAESLSSPIATNTNASATPSTAASPVVETPNPATSQIAAVTPTPTPITNTTTTAPGASADIEKLLATVPEITDPSQLRALNRQVYNQINPAWANRNTFTEDVIYRVGVAADGAIIGYKPVNKGANEIVDKTPLPNLLYNPATRGPITKEPIGQFRVVFTTEGVLQVSPWLGYSATPHVVGQKIADANQVKDLNKKLYDTFRKNWGGTPSFKSDLKYRVAVNQEGRIADYEPLNQVAFDYFRETPLPKMFQEIYGSNVAAPNNKEALAHYEVVFKPNGSLEVQPWQGYR